MEMTDNLLKFLDTKYCFPHTLDRLSTKLSKLESELVSNRSTPVDIIEYLSKFPCYNKEFNPITNISAFNLNAIRMSTTDDVDNILSFIDPSVLPLKFKLDKYETSHAKLNFDTSSQLAWNTSSQDLFNKSNDVLTYKYTPEFLNYIYDILGSSTYFTHNVTSLNFFHILVLYNFFVNILDTATSFNSVFHDYVKSSRICSNTTIMENTCSFIDNHVSNYSESVALIILQNNYEIIKPSTSLTELIKSEFVDNLQDFKTSITSYISTYKSDHSARYVADAIICYNHNYALDMLNDLDMSIIKNPNSNSISAAINLDALVTEYYSKVDKFNTASYFYLLHYYKFYPYKFLSIVPEIFKEFTNSKIFNIDQFNFISKTQLRNALSLYQSDLNLDKLDLFLQDKLESIDSYDNPELTRYITMYVFLDMFDSYFDSSEFLAFIDKLFKSCRDVMVNEQYIDNNDNYYRNIHNFRMFFKCIFKNALIDGKLLSELNADISTIINNIDNEVSTPYSETLFDIVPNYTLSFVTQYAYDPDSLIVYIDDVPFTGEITKFAKKHIFSLPITFPNSKISCSYDINYKITRTSTNLKSSFKSFLHDTTIAESLTNFSKNMVMSSITKRLVYNTMNHYMQ